MKEYYLARWILPVHRPPVEHGFLAIENGLICDIGLIGELSHAIQESYHPEHDQTLIAPGFVNAHTHLELSFGQLIPKTTTMSDWLIQVGQLLKQASNEENAAEQKYERCLQGIRELTSAGVTCVNDIASDGASLAALDQTGLRGVVSLEFFHPGHSLKTLPIFEIYQDLKNRYQDHPRLHVGLSPHSPYNVSPIAWRHAITALQPPLIHTHVGESQDEIDWLSGQPSGIDTVHQFYLNQLFRPLSTGHSPISYLEQNQLLTPGLIMAHGVFVAERALNLLKERGIRLAHCPRSNLYLQNKTISLPMWLDHKIPVGLGTDSHLSSPALCFSSSLHSFSSSPSLDLREEARLAMQLHHISPEIALSLLTQGGAAVLGMPDQIGRLAPGFLADFVCWEASLKSLNKNKPEAVLLAPATQTKGVFISGRKVPATEQTSHCHVLSENDNIFVE